MTKWIGLAAGGILGTFARYFLSGAVHRVFGTTFPWGTLVVNLAKDGENLYAFMNIALSVVLGFLVFRLGVMLARWI